MAGNAPTALVHVLCVGLSQARVSALRAKQVRALAKQRGCLRRSPLLEFICVIIFAAAVYAALAWLVTPQAVVLPPCVWRWRALRCSAGCKVRMPGKCKLQAVGV